MLLGQISAHFQSWSELWFGKHMGTCVESKYFNKAASALSCPGRSWELGHQGDDLQLIRFHRNKGSKSLGHTDKTKCVVKGIEHHNTALLSASRIFVFASPFLQAPRHYNQLPTSTSWCLLK